jgi:hypothetical protein
VVASEETGRQLGGYVDTGALLLAHGCIARGASRSSSPAIHASSSRLPSPSLSMSSSPSPSTCRSSVPHVGKRRASGECAMD